MRKILSHSILAMAAAALIVPSMSAQTASRRSARTSSAETRQTVQTNPRLNAPQMLVRDGKTGYSSSLRQSASSIMALPATSARDQMRQASGGAEIWGNVIYSDKPDGSTTNAHLGMWKISTEGEFSSLYPKSLGGCYSAVVVDGVYHNYFVTSLLGMTIPNYAAYDIETWAKVETPVTSVTGENMPFSLCTDGTNVYGQYTLNNTFKFGKFDLNTNTWTHIADCEKQWNGCAYGNDGNIYAIDMAGDCLKVVPATGAATKLGATGVVPKYITGATIDKKTGRMFWTVCPEDEHGYLYEVNTTTGAATKLCQFQYNDEVAGIFVPFIAYDKAPAAATDLTTTFNNGSLTGKVTFKCPTTLYDGTAASGSLTYKVLANGEQVATGNCSYGQNVTADVTVPLAGNYTLTVILSNNTGDGPKTKTSLFIGKDTPKPTTVTIAYNNGKFNVSWTPVTQTVNGGYMDLSKVNYTVTRYPDKKVVAANTTATSYEDAVPMPENYTTYYYTVVVNCDGISSSPAQSNIIGLGDITPPYTQDFSNKDAFNDFLVIDANNDGISWNYYDGAVRVKYSTKVAMDDWLVTPAIALEAGKSYKFSLDARCHSASFKEAFEVKMGTAPTVEAMTMPVMGTIDVLDKVYENHEAYITVPTTGNYYIGIHGISAKNMFYLYVDNISISAPMDGGAPAEATELTATADASGSLKAVVKGKAPAKSLNGNNLTQLSKIEIARDGETVKTITGIQPGREFTFEDNAIPTNGEHKWTVTCSNDKGAGKSASVSTFVGFDVPAAVTNVQMTETADGKVKITWTAPTADVNGKPLGSTPITYTIVDASNTSTIFAQNHSGTTFEYTVCTEGQDFFQAGVFAVTDAGTSQGVAGPFMAIGFPYAIPYSESFANGQLVGILGISKLAGNGASWSIQKDGGLGINSADNDNGYIAGKFSSLNDASMVFTGKIDLTTAENPAFSFYTYNITNGTQDDLNEIDVTIREVGTEDWTVLKHGTVNELCNGDTSVWKPVKVSLNAYKGKKVQVGLKGVSKGYVYVMFDKLQVSEDLAHNLGVAEITAPETVKPNDEFAISVDVENRGRNTESDYSVEFYRDGASEPFKTVKGVAIAPGATATFNAPAILTFDEADASAKYHAVVKFAADLNQNDNTSSQVTVTRVYSTKPAPTALSATREGDNVNLLWTAPAPASTQRYANGNLEDFEGFTSWTNEPGDWTILDIDQAPRGGFQNIEIPNHPVQSKGSFFVFDVKDSNTWNQSFASHSGTKYLASLFNYDASQVDDWAISPMLSGNAQTISFWARSYSKDYPETFEVLYSTSGKATTDFVSAKVVSSVPAQWTEYSVELPAGAKYFAVRNISTDKFMLMLDDFTFESKPDELVGYNVYRDNVKINSEVLPATQTSYTDAISGNHTYHVTAVYASGEESAPSNAATNGVGTIEAGISIVGGNGFIAIAGAEGKQVTVIDMKGVMLFNAKVENDVRVEAAPGIYMVRVANGTVKVIVK